MSVTEVSQNHVSCDTCISTYYSCGQTCKGKRGLLAHTRRCSKRHTAPMVEPKETDNNSVYAETNGVSNSVTMTDMKPNVNTMSQMDDENGAVCSNPSITVRPVISRKSQPTGHVSATCISYDQCQSYHPKLRRKLHHHSNPFIIRRYDSRIKKCRGCGNEFKCDTAGPKFVIVHKKLSVYVSVNDTKHILTIPLGVFYHCDPACIQIRYPYFQMRCVTVLPAIMRELNDDDAERLLSLGIKLFL